MVHVKCEKLTKTYGDIIALDGIDLEVEDGEYLAILGPTGAGKTSTMYLLAGLISPNSGKIYFDGVDVTSIPAEDREVGFVFEEYNLFPHMLVEDNILFGPKVKNLPLKESQIIASELMNLLNIQGKETSYPEEISGGQKQRVALARAITAQAKLLIMDDPLRALDAKIREMLQVELRKLIKDLKLTCIHATHDTHEAMRVADKIAVFHKGKIVQMGSPEEIYNNPKTLYVGNFLTESNIIEGTIIKEKEETFLLTKTNEKIRVESNLPHNAQAIALLPAELVDIYEISKRETIKYDNIFSAEVLHSRCIGEFYEFRLSSIGQNIKCRELIGKKLKVKKKQAMLFCTDRHDYRIFPYNEQELKEVLEDTQ